MTSPADRLAQSAIARIEGGRGASVSTIYKVAVALDVEIVFRHKDGDEVLA